MQLSLLIKTILISAIFSLLSACGGGGSSDTPKPQNPKNPQILSFEYSVAPIRSVNSTFTNKAVGQGTGAISYKSSNPASASVDSDGLVSLLEEGDITITATIAEDAYYQAATASYSFTAAEVRCAVMPGTLAFASESVELKTGELFINELTRHYIDSVTFSSSNTDVATVSSNGTVTALSKGTSTITAEALFDHCGEIAHRSYTVQVTDTTANEIAIAAWIGAQDTLFKIPAAASGLAFYRSSAATCDFTQHSSCANGQMDIVDGAQITDTATRLDRSGFYLFKNDQSQAPLTLHSANHPATNAAQLLNFNNQLWSFRRSPQTHSLDTWSSSDGLHWTQVATPQNFLNRTDHKIAIHNNRFWLAGGYTASGIIPTNDIWSSADGINWSLASSVEGFTRSHHQLVSFNNKLWLIGGDYVDPIAADLNNNTHFYNDIWSSSDGVTWVRELEHASFAGRSGHQVIAFNNQLWLFGGYNKEGRLGDIWSSSDGISWTQQTAHSSFSNRIGYKLAVHVAQLWIIAGSEITGDKRDIWSSGDGVTWTQESEQAALSARNDYQLVNFNNGLLLTGGSTSTVSRSDSWFSADGVEWRQGFIGSFHISE